GGGEGRGGVRGEVRRGREEREEGGDAREAGWGVGGEGRGDCGGPSSILASWGSSWHIVSRWNSTLPGSGLLVLCAACFVEVELDIPGVGFVGVSRGLLCRGGTRHSRGRVCWVLARFALSRWNSTFPGGGSAFSAVGAAFRVCIQFDPQVFFPLPITESCATLVQDRCPNECLRNEAVPDGQCPRSGQRG